MVDGELGEPVIEEMDGNLSMAMFAHAVHLPRETVS